LTSHTTPQDAPEAPLPEDLARRLQAHGVSARDEVALRCELERHAPTYTLVRLNSIATRWWKARYRIMLGERYLDMPSVSPKPTLALSSPRWIRRPRQSTRRRTVLRRHERSISPLRLHCQQRDVALVRRARLGDDVGNEPRGRDIEIDVARQHARDWLR